MKNLIIIFFLFISSAAIAQYDFVQINLEIVDNKTQVKEMRISLFKTFLEDKYMIAVKQNPKIDFESMKLEDIPSQRKQDGDSIQINKADFDLLVKSVFELSKAELFLTFNGHPTPVEIACKYDVILELVVGGYDKMIYEITCPNYEVETRNLQSFETVCEKIFKLANLNYKNFFYETNH